MMTYYAEHALLPDGWATRVRLDVDAGGSISAVLANADAAGAERLSGPLLPGMPNLHSHAFQRAMAGLGEVRGSPDDDFWNWRELMYKFAGRITPQQSMAVARHLYIEMLKSGYTAVAEFHYVHNDPTGQPYANPAEMSLAHVAAASEAGIAITMLPVLYSNGNFGAAPLGPRQQRFRTGPEDILATVRAVRKAAAGHADLNCGVAPHSLRAAGLDGLRDLLTGLEAIDASAPIHIHIAEQTREVDDSLAFSGQRPVAWLLEHLPVDHRWCLVHATHLNNNEMLALARSGAIAGLCPTTEGNLGDGIFPLPDYRAAGGRYGIGSDSHVSRNPLEELRLLEYVQRLVLRKRNLVVGNVSAAVGTTLWLEAAAGGAQAMGRKMGALAAGQRADFVVLDGEQPDIAGKSGDMIANAAIFSGTQGLVRDVMVGGRWQVRDGRHALEDSASRDYGKAVKALLA
ncbi:MAG: formimidoylglutamate deiminase [Betaproteobacteria bacterium]|jgi:formimidoylglutamate deiminase|nr:formimidoylglutamate deiminase [Betaproteobacteria bacterium]